MNDLLENKLKAKRKEYVSFIRKIINDIYSGKIEIDKDDYEVISGFTSSIWDVNSVFESISWTARLDCFNGSYEMNEKNCDYYIRKLCEHYNLKCKKHKKLAQWTVMKNDAKYYLTCHYTKQKTANNRFNNFVSIDYVNDKDHERHNDYYSFSELDTELSFISQGNIY